VNTVACIDAAHEVKLITMFAQLKELVGMSTGLSMSALCIGDVSKCLGWEGQKHLEEQVVDHTAPLQRHGVVNGRAEEERCGERAEECLGK
jgi:hypothetical protein